MTLVYRMRAQTGRQGAALFDLDWARVPWAPQNCHRSVRVLG